MGKKSGMDSKNKKATYPALSGMEESKKWLNTLTEVAIDALSKYYDNAEVFVKLAKDLAVRDK